MRNFVSLIVGAACGLVGVALGHRARTRVSTTITIRNESATTSEATSTEARNTPWSLLLERTALTMSVRWRVLFLGLGAVGSAGLMIALGGSPFSAGERLAAAASASVLLTFFLTFGPRHLTTVSADMSRRQRVWDHVLRWFAVALPRFQFATLVLFFATLGFVVSDRPTLGPRGVSIVDNTIAAALGVVAVAIGDIAFSYQRQLRVLRRNTGPQLRLLLRGQHLDVQDVAVLFTMLSRGADPRTSTFGVIDRRRADTAVEVYRLTESTELLRGIVQEALEALGLHESEDNEYLQKWARKGVPGSPSRARSLSLVAAYFSDPRATLKTHAIAHEWVSQDPPRDVDPPLRELWASLDRVESLRVRR